MEIPGLLETSQEFPPLSTSDFPDGSVDKGSSCNAGDTGDAGLIPGWGGPLEEKMAAHSRILSWRIPWTGEPGRLYSPKDRKEPDETKPILTLNFSSLNPRRE